MKKKGGQIDKTGKNADPFPEGSEPAVSLDFGHLDGVQLGRIFGVTRNTVTNWDRTGCPRNPDNTWSSQDVIKWFVSREVKRSTPRGYSELERTKLENEISLQNLKIAETERRVLSRDKVELVLGNMCHAFRVYWTARWQQNLSKLLKSMGLGADRAPAVKKVMDGLVKESFNTFLGEARELEWENVKIPK